MIVFFFNDTATTEIYTLSLHDALPIYCRLSKFGGRGLGGQEQDCRQIVAARGWTVGEVFQETASASPYSKKARKEWLRLLDAIQHHEFDAVVVWLEDRSNRSVVEAA